MSEVAAEGQQHPIGLYLKVWLLLFVFSAGSYMVDYMQLQGELRWFLIVVFMWLKAAFIVAIFMHMRWERMALITAILLPPIAIAVLVFLMAVEGGYTFFTRLEVFGG
ncbi:MAG: cytochrome C oxidase subunit IV family protein [Gammaproteobacteria bacterium]|nr:cytochrome C oxidase subunit IV family protein [Gammaproteobacteria bacterium]